MPRNVFADTRLWWPSPCSVGAHWGCSMAGMGAQAQAPEGRSTNALKTFPDNSRFFTI